MSSLTLQDLESAVLGIKMPFGICDAPMAFAFDRNRELTARQIPWDEEGYPLLHPGGGDTLEFDPRLLLQYFRSHWGEKSDQELQDQAYIALLGRTYIDPHETANEVCVVGALPKLASVRVPMSPDPPAGDAKGVVHGPPTLERGETVLPWTLDDEENNRHLILSIDVRYEPKDENEHGDVLAPGYYAGRRFFRPYHIQDGRVEYFAWEGTKDRAKFNQIWEPGNSYVVAGVEVIFCGIAEDYEHALQLARGRAASGFSFVDIIRADAAVIERQYRGLENDASVAGALHKAGTDLLDQIRIGGQGPKVVQALAQQARELMRPLEEIDAKKKQLADAATDLGYKLFLEKNPKFSFKTPDGVETPISVAQGDLYRMELRLVTWTTWHTVKRKTKRLFSSRTYTYQVPRTHAEILPYFEKVNTDYDPWAEASRQYVDGGYVVYQFHFRGDGQLATADDVLLAEIMNRCEEDETFRRRCVVAIPVHENTIIGRDLLIGYAFHTRPMKGLITSGDPAITLYERLAYRFTWESSHLGELASSIPLAPGEEREITISKVEARESSISTTASSLVELTSTSRLDFETTFEKEVRRESTTNKTQGGSISGTYKGVTAGLNGSRNKTVREVAQTLDRAVKRTSQELTRKEKSETLVSTTDTTSVSISNTVNYRVSNINQGTTMNLLLFRIYGRYVSRLELEDYLVGLEAGPFLIEGLPYREVQLFEKQDLTKLGDALKKDALPVPVPGDDDAQWDVFQNWLAKRLCCAIGEEYGKQTDCPFGIEWREKTEKGVVTTSLQEEYCRQLTADGSQPLAMLSWLLESAQMDRAFKEERFAFDSGAFYIDTMLGVRKATEPYSDEMRTLEKRYRAAEARLVETRAAAIGGPYEDFRYLRSEFFTDAEYGKGNNRATMRLWPETLVSREWVLVIDETDRIEDPEIYGNTLVFQFPRDFDYLHDWKPRDWATRSYLEKSDASAKLAYRVSQDAAK